MSALNWPNLQTRRAENKFARIRKNERVVQIIAPKLQQFLFSWGKKETKSACQKNKKRVLSTAAAAAVKKRLLLSDFCAWHSLIKTLIWLFLRGRFLDEHIKTF